ncbi:MAG: RNA-binding transcriptional accessory protein, partial [Eubacterium sp.]|nr:RNA-binding transcriptional accessory protein [Eubacterium sp.]
MDIIKKIAEELGLRRDRAEAVVELMDEGNTVPFIARYRKERTGGMDDETLRAFDERLKYLRNLEDRKATVLASIEEQGKLTDELRKEIEDAETAARVEDLYRPYKPKRRTRATIAKERGLEPLADLIRDRRAKTDPAEAAEGFVDPEKGVPDADAAIAGALDIIAGDLSDDAEIREYIRKTTFEQGVLA